MTPQAFLAYLSRGGVPYLWTKEARKDGKSSTVWLTPGGALPRMATDRHVYFGVHPSKVRRGPNQRAKIEHVAAINCLFAEYDAKDFEGNKEQSLAYIHQRTPAPSVVVDSGGGYHCYWLLRDTFLLKTSADQQRADRAQKGWVALMGGDDGAKDLARVLRLPGYRNLKPEYGPDFPLVSFVTADFDKLYTLEQLEAHIPATAPLPPKPSGAILAPGQLDARQAAYVQAAIDGELRAIASAGNGSRNKSLNNAAFALGQLVGSGKIDRATAEHSLEASAESVGLVRDDGQQSVRTTIKSGLDAGEKEPRQIPAATQPPAKVRSSTNGHSAAEKQDGPPEDPIQILGITKTLADAVLARDHFAQDGGGKLYVFANGTWEPRGERIIKQHVKSLLCVWEKTKYWSSHRADEVVEYIRTDAPILWEQPPLNIINVKNGLLNVLTRELRPHNPDHLSPVQLPVTYDPAATCPDTERFIQSTFPDDASEVAWQIVAWLMTAYTAIQKAVLLLGEGSNGKSTWLASLIAFLGKANVASISLHKLETDRFSGARLIGKLANICPDLPSAHLAGTSIFKALTGGDQISVEHKYHTSFDLTPMTRLIFSANHPPQSSDASFAFFRRWLVIPFNRTFEGGNVIPRAQLDAMLADPKELSGVLNRALDALPSVRAEGFTETESMRSAWDEFRETTDPLAVWLDMNTVELPDAHTTKHDLLMAYNRACAAAGRPAMTNKAFGQAIKRSRPQLQEAQRTVSAKTVWVWLGIGLRAPGGAISDSLDSRDSRDPITVSNSKFEGM